MYQYGEPYDEQNITLTTQSMQSMGNYLVPIDPAPVIEFYDTNITDPSISVSYITSERNVTIDVNETTSSDFFEYAVRALDPFDMNRSIFTWETDVNASFLLGATTQTDIEFLVDGNFTPYLDLNESRSDFYL